MFHYLQRPINFCLLFLLGAGNVGVSLSSKAADTVNVTFKTTVVAPTCTMTVPTFLDLNAKQPRGIITQDAVEAGTVTDYVNINFTDCANGSLLRTPTITVMGRTVALGNASLYFADTPTTVTLAEGYGIKLSVTGDSNFTDMNNIATVLGDNGGGKLTAKAGKTLASLNGSTLKLNAQLTCGAYSPCFTNSHHKAGGFKASITFQLAYD